MNGSEPVDRHGVRRAQLIARHTMEIVAFVRGGRIVHCGPAISDVLGYRPESTIGQALFEYLHPADRSAGIEFVAACRSGGSPRARFRLLASDDTYRTIEALGRLVPGEGPDDPPELLLVGHDVTALVDRERELRVSEERLQALLDAGSDLVILVSRDGHYLDCKASPDSPFADLHDSLIGRSISEIRAPGEFADALVRIARVLDTGAPAVFEEQLEVDGVQRYYVSRTTRYDDDTVLAATRDVTLQRRAEIAARASDDRYRRIVEAASEGIWWFDEHGITTSVNQQMADMLGLPVHAMIGRHADEFLDTAGRLEARALARRRRKGLPDNYPRRFRAADGREVWCFVSATPVFDGQGEFRGSVGLVTDITSERESVARVERNEARFRALVEQSSDMFTVLGRGDVVLFTSNNPSRLLGSPRVLSHLELRDRRHPDDESIVRTSIERLWAEGPNATVRYTYRMARDDGSWRVIETIGRNLEHVAGVDGLALHSRDITDRVAAEDAAREIALAGQRLAAEQERSRLQVELERALRFERLGRLAAGIAHDFNNLLGVMGNYLRVLHRQLDEAHSAQEDVEGIASAIERASELTRDLLAYGDTGDAPAETLELAEVVHGLVEFAAQALGADIQLQLVVDDDARVRAPRVGLERCVLNLLTNARDAMPEGGRVVVRTGVTELGTDTDTGLQEGRYATVTVHDAGTGMDSAVVALASQPFFTTKGTEGGSGLGLAIVRGIVEDAGGAVRIASTPGRGTAVTLLLPVVTAA